LTKQKKVKLKYDNHTIIKTENMIITCHAPV
jgi:hypothetical protein